MLLLLLVLTITFGLTAFKRLRMPFENGRYFDEKNSTVLAEQSILVYFILSAVTSFVDDYFDYKYN